MLTKPHLCTDLARSPEKFRAILTLLIVLLSLRYPTVYKLFSELKMPEPICLALLVTESINHNSRRRQI